MPLAGSSAGSPLSPPNPAGTISSFLASPKSARSSIRTRARSCSPWAKGNVGNPHGCASTVRQCLCPPATAITRSELHQQPGKLFSAGYTKAGWDRSPRPFNPNQPHRSRVHEERRFYSSDGSALARRQIFQKTASIPARLGSPAGAGRVSTRAPHSVGGPIPKAKRSTSTDREKQRNPSRA